MNAGPDMAIEQLKQLGPVEYVLFDASHGKGVEMNPEALLPFLEASYADATLVGNHTQFGVAGGLNQDNVTKHLPRIVHEFPSTSWDAEGNLHSKPVKVVDTASGEERWQSTDEGELRIGLTWDYLKASANVIRQK